MLRIPQETKCVFASILLCCVSLAALADPTTWAKKTPIPGTVAGASCITSTTTGDTIIVGTYDKGIFVSPDGGNSWVQTLSFAADSVVYCIKHVGGRKVLAGAEGRVYVSDNNGMTWRNASIAISYPVRDIIAISNRLYVCTGDYFFGVAHGDGVLVSQDGGSSWIRKNTGLPEHESVWNLAADKLGRIFVTCIDLDGTGDGGLYYTANDGAMWTKIPMAIDGRGVILDAVNITEAYDLAIDPHDSIVCSADAISGSVSVTGIFKNTFGGALASAKWNISGLRPSPSFWQRTHTRAIYFIDTTGILGSYSGGAVTGGPYHSTDGGNTWERMVGGVDMAGMGYNANAYAAGRGKRIYMIQHEDNDLYYSDSLKGFPAETVPVVAINKISIFPNPSQHVLHIAGDVTDRIKEITIIGADGSVKQCKTAVSGNNITVHHHLPPGCYFLRYITGDQSSGTVRFTVAE